MPKKFREKRLFTKPSVFQNARGELWTLVKGQRDITLFHPRSVYREGRPTWLRFGVARKPYHLTTNPCAGTARCLVRARFAAEDVDAVPIDQVEAVAGHTVPALMLPAGEFVLEVKDADDKMLKTWRVKFR